MDAQVKVMAEDVPVAAKPRRRTYTAQYKRRILKGSLHDAGRKGVASARGLVLLALGRLAPRPRAMRVGGPDVEETSTPADARRPPRPEDR